MADAQQAQKQIHAKVVNDTLKRIAEHKGVIGYLVLHPRTGSLLQAAGFKEEKPEKYREPLHAFLQSAQSVVRTLNHSDALTFLRMRYRQREIIMAPDLGGDYVLIVIHEHKVAWKSGVAQIAEQAGVAPTEVAGAAA